MTWSGYWVTLPPEPDLCRAVPRRGGHALLQRPGDGDPQDCRVLHLPRHADTGGHRPEMQATNR